MNKFIPIALLAGALVAPATHAAYQATVAFGDFSYDVGEVVIDPNADLAAEVAGYSAATLRVPPYSGDKFPTFCLELTETFDLSTTYNVALSNGAVGGGVSGGNPDKISYGTAWLYRQFAGGTLTGYDFNDTGVDYDTSGVGNSERADLVGRNGAAGLLQEAIWYLEGEISSLSLLLGTEAGTNPFLALAQGASYPAGKTYLSDAEGAYNVKVMNMTSVASGTLRQDFLIVVPEASTYIAGALLGLPFLAGAIRRRVRRAS